MPISQAPTAGTSRFVFYDVESLANVFTVAFYEPASEHHPTPELEIFVLTEPGDPLGEVMESIDSLNTACDVIRAKNSALPDNTQIRLAHLNTSASAAHYMMSKFGVSSADDVHRKHIPTHKNLTPLCDTSEDYDHLRAHPFYAGYNSFNYDLTILAIVYSQLAEAFSTQRYDDEVEDYYLNNPLRPSSIRAYNDEIFRDYIERMPAMLTDGNSSIGRFGRWNSDAARIRRNFISSGRHIDVSKFNEVQQKVGLKRQLGALGRQILESDKLGPTDNTIEDAEGLFELMAYNASDVIGLHHLFQHPVYTGGFDLKASLLYEYPETVYDRDESGSPVIDPECVRSDRLTIDETSAKFVARILAPYKGLTDIPAVSFMYPHPEIAEELGIQSVDVLDAAKDFFYANVTGDDDASRTAREQFDRVYAFYSSIRGKNFNSSAAHNELFISHPPYSFNKSDSTHARYGNEETAHLELTPVNIPYYRTDGEPTDYYATFSTGGIHGAQFNAALAAVDNEDIDAYNTALEQAKSQFLDPLDFWGQTITAGDGTVYKHTHLYKTGSTKKKLTQLSQLTQKAQSLGLLPDEQKLLDELKNSVGYREPKPRRSVFPVSAQTGREALNARYAMTSMVPTCFHEDFTSYYPNMLRNMKAFYNPDLGEDRYAKIFQQKEDYGVLRKDPNLSEDERTLYGIKREGTKLILNSATGAGGTPYDNPIRMNNQILSMRLIGQILTWRVAQAQVFAGADMPSTNTDGIYSSGLEKTVNNAVLAREAEKINVEIEPEAMRLVSKDANNRAEFALDGSVMGTGGSSLAAFKEPLLTKTSTAPAIRDRVLTLYLGALLDEPMGLTIESDFNRDTARLIYDSVADELSLRDHVKMMQHIVSSSRGSLRYVFTFDPDSTQPTVESAHPVQHYNRIFFVKPGTKGAQHLRYAVAKKITPASQRKRKTDGMQSNIVDPVAESILAANGASFADSADITIPEDRDLAVTKVTNVDEDALVVIWNEDLLEADDATLQALIDSLDIEYYLTLIERDYTANWKNPTLG